MLRKVAAFLLLSAAALWAQPSERHFTFTYKFHLNDVPSGQKLRLWIPMAASDAFQTVRLVSAKGDLPLKRTRESEYGNSLFYAEAPKATRARYDFEIVYDVVRRERAVDLPHAASPATPLPGSTFRATSAAGASPSPHELHRFLQPDRLVPVTGLPAELAAREVAGRTTELAKARALYEYVYRTLRYDKSGTGWGQGDVLYACDARKGNCTDFHSLFIAMARSQGIPARFEIGFSIPPGQTHGEIVGYHCWADFYLDGSGWVPVDISEAWKHPEKHDYFFGHHDVDRVQFSLGRDLTLSPHQEGASLNYFLYPYAELGGKEYGNVVSEFSFAEVR